MKKVMKKIYIILLICVIGGLFIGAKSCTNRNSNTKIGSSNDNTFMINAPLNLTATAISPYQISLTWQDNSNNEDGFELERSLDGTNYLLLSTTYSNVVSYSDINLVPFTTYYYRVRSFNTVGDRSIWSNEANAVTNITAVWSVVAAGEGHSFALTANKILWAWGWNQNGQLGLNDSNNVLILYPTQINQDSDWSLIEAGAYHSLSTKNNGTLWAWGSNNYGQLGLGDTEDDRYIPTQVGIDSYWLQVSGGGNHTVGLKTNGTIFSWGYNNYGQLGSGDTNDRYTPTQIGSVIDWSVIEAGYNHTLALKTDSTLWVWGWNEFGQLGLGDTQSRSTPIQIGSVSDWQTVVAGYGHTVARKTDGSLWSWGYNDTIILIPTQIGADTDWSVISAGGESSDAKYNVALRLNGTIWSWGSNLYGQLGLGDVNYRSLPTKIGTNSGWIVVAAGGYHTLAVKNDGSLWVWGGNQYGQLGFGDTAIRYVPCPLGSPASPSYLTITPISSNQNNLFWIDNSINESGFKIERRAGPDELWNQISVVSANVASYSDIYSFYPGGVYHYRIRAYNEFDHSFYSNEVSIPVSGIWQNAASNNLHNFAVKMDSTLWAWGRNDKGQLGDGSIIDRYTPRQIGTDCDWNSLAVGYNYSFAIKTNLTLWGWGSNLLGQLGDGTSNNTRITPREIGIDSDWTYIAAGKIHAVALKTNLTVWAWGNNLSGQLGDGTSNTIRITPREIGIDSDWAYVLAGNLHTIALKTNSTVWAWGNNQYGQLGDGSTNNRMTPRQIEPDLDWVNITSGYSHNLAVKTGSTLWSWGINSYGQLGDDTVDKRLSPRQIGIDSDWFAVTSIGGKMNPMNLSAIAASEKHSLAIKSNLTLWAWGNNQFGQLGDLNIQNTYIPNQVGVDSDWSKIAAGQNHSLAIKKNNTLWTWGDNIYGQLGRNYGLDYLPTPVSVNNPSHTPSNLTVTATYSTQIDLSWMDNCPIEKGFKIERKTGIAGTWAQINTVLQNVMTYSDTSVSPATTYYYRVRVFNDYSDSNYSNEANATTP